jgi:hypothetical protein
MTAGARHHVHPENPWAGSGSVLLDIGGDVGALVVTMPEGLEGREVEIRPAAYVASAGRPVHHPHVAVVPRPVGSRRVPSLVFPGLSEGAYELCEKGTDQARLAVRVVGGRVTEARWPS